MAASMRKVRLVDVKILFRKLLDGNVKFPTKCVHINSRALSATFETQDAKKNPTENSELKSPLVGVRVLDLTRVLAGPFCTMMLGDLGADIIKVERPGVGDDTRQWGPPFVADESCYFLSINRNKKSICVNLKHPDGLKIIQKIAAKSDILVENYVPGKLTELGLGYEDLRKIAPSLIYCSITGYGPDGPYAGRGGYDVVAAAMGGLLHITGPQQGDPVRVGVAMTDLSTGLFAKAAILGALYHRERTGQGQKIDCNLLSTQVAIMSHIGTNYLMGGMEAKRWGTGHSSIVPYQAFKTSDGRFLIVGAGNNGHFKILCKLLKMDHLLNDERYESNELRVANRTPLIEGLSQRFQEKTLSEWEDVFDGCSIPYGPIQSMEQVFQDPQILHNKMIQSLEHPTVGQVRVPGPPVDYSTIQTDARLPPPRLAEHTQQVLQELLGYDPTQVQQLEESGAISILKSEKPQS